MRDTYVCVPYFSVLLPSFLFFWRSSSYSSSRERLHMHIRYFNVACVPIRHSYNFTVYEFIRVQLSLSLFSFLSLSLSFFLHSFRVYLIHATVRREKWETTLVDVCVLLPKQRELKTMQVGWKKKKKKREK